MDTTIWSRAKPKIMPVIGLFAGLATLGEFQIRANERKQEVFDANNKIHELKMETMLNQMKAIEEQRKSNWFLR